MKLIAWFILILGLVAAPLVGASLWLDARGHTAAATVTGRHEAITFRRDPAGRWTRKLELEVEFTPPGSDRSASLVSVDAARFDSLHRGDPVEIRYLPFWTMHARLADRTTATMLRSIAADLAVSEWLVWLPAGAVALILAARIGTVPVLAAGVLWLAAAVPLFFQPRVPVVPTGAEATAQVLWTSVVDRASSYGRRGNRSPKYLATPYEVVQLHFLPAGRTDSVLAADAVDSGSVPGLADLATLRVRYEPRAPRHARLVEGTRAFPLKNRYHYLFEVLAVVALGVFMALVWRLRRRKAAVRP